MTVESRPLFEISRAGHAALVRELGVVDAVRFLNQYTTGRGNYTEDRNQWLGGEPLDALFAQVQQADRKRNA